MPRLAAKAELRGAITCSGGALPLGMNIWQIAAPRIDIFSPDIYYGNFSDWCKTYSQSGQSLSIPETRGGEIGAANALLAIGRHSAIGFSPFGIDAGNQSALAEVYGCLEQLGPIILAHQTDGSMSAALLDTNNPTQILELGGYTLNVALRHEHNTFQTSDHGYVLVICTSGPIDLLWPEKMFKLLSRRAARHRRLLNSEKWKKEPLSGTAGFQADS